MNKEYMPAWLETLWNVNPILARRAEKELEELMDKVEYLSLMLQELENKEDE